MWTIEHWQGEAAPKPASVAIHKVIAIIELREMIFLKLPIVDLLVNAQRVCKEWHAAIKSSKRLQQALFLRPIPVGKLYWEYAEEEQYIMPGKISGENYWYAESEVVCKTPGEKCGHYSPTEEDHTMCKDYENAIAANPFIKHIAKNWHLWIAKKTDKRLYAPDASWRRMLISQPPVGHCEIVYWNYPWDHYEFQEARLVREGLEWIADDNKQSHGTARDGMTLYNLMLERHIQCRDTTLFFPRASSGWKEVETGEDVFNAEAVQKRTNWEADLDKHGLWRHDRGPYEDRS